MNPFEKQLMIAHEAAALDTRVGLRGLADATSDQIAAVTSSPWFMAWRVAALASGAACAYHGFKRHRGSVGWAIGWGVLGSLFFPITPAIAVAEGFGKPARKS